MTDVCFDYITSGGMDKNVKINIQIISSFFL